MKRRAISLLLIISLMISFIPAFSSAHAADDLTVPEEVYGNHEENILFQARSWEDEYIRVRVEGYNSTLFNKEIPFTAEMDNALDVLKAAVGEENIKGSRSSYGYLITSIMGEDGPPNAGWSYYVEFNDGTIVQPMVAVDEFKGLRDDGKLNCRELVFYMTAYSGANILTKITKITVESSGASYTIKVADNTDNNPISNVNVCASFVGNFKTDSRGEVTFNIGDRGIYNIYVSKDGEYPAIVRKHILLTRDMDDNAVSELVYSVDDLVNYYRNDELSPLAVMAYNSAINNSLDYKDTYKPNTKNNVKAYAENILGLIATGQNPKTYVNQLVREQDSDGLFSQDPAVQAMGIRALDMAGADYDETRAVQQLIEMAEDGHYRDVVETADVMTALSKHKDVEGVNELLSTCVAYLKEEQLDNGGFDYFSMGNSPYAVGPVIQALVANGINPLSAQWTKNGNSLLDALLASRLDDGTFRFSEEYGYNMTDPGATQHAFAALVDLYRGISVYDKFLIEKQGEEDKSHDEIISEVVDGLRDYFTSMKERLDSSWQTHPAYYTPLEALALNATSDDIQRDVEDIAKKLKINENAGTLPYAMNIIGMISSGQNSAKYVDALVGAQQEDGSFKLGSVEQTEWAVIALDMAGAQYDVEKAVNFILGKSKNQSSIDLLAIALAALAPHKDIEGVESYIEENLDYINENQLESGGFVDSLGMENSYTLSYVISALVANGIDPLTDERWIKNDKTLLDALLEYRQLNYFIYNKTYGEYLYKDEATAQAFIALSDLLHKKSTYQNVQETVSYKGKIRDGLFKLRDYLTTTQKRANNSLEEVDVFYTWLEALAINHTSSDLKEDYPDLQAKLQLNTGDDVISYPENILGLIASGQVLSSHEEDYVQSLIAMQNSQGEFVEEGKASSVRKQSMAILALDLAGADYDVRKAVSALLNMAEGNNFGDVENTAFALIALSKHEDIAGVSKAIEEGIDYLKSMQTDSGGFDMYGYGDTPQYTGLVIQALIANGVDPLSEEWEKPKGNLVDSLLHDQMADGTFRMCEAFGDYVDVTSTSRAFGALADLYTRKSLYHSIEPVLNSSDVVAMAIKDAKGYIQSNGQYNYFQAMALNILGVSEEEIAEKLELREDEADRTYIVWDSPTEAHAKNIMGIIAAGQNPRDYRGKDYVSILEKAQDPHGEFNIEGDRENRLEDQAYSIIALEMARGKYDIEKALDVLMEKYENANDPSIFRISETIIALSFHKDREGIDDKIEDCIDDLKACQTDSGGLKYSAGSYSGSESSEYHAMAIQAIIAAGKNPLSADFKKNDNTILDALMAFKRDNCFIYDSSKKGYREYTDEATGMALAALVDISEGKSMYHTLVSDYEEDGGPKTNEEKIRDTIASLRNYYLNSADDFTYRVALSYNLTSDNLEHDLPIVEQRFKVNESPDSASAYVGNIMGLLAAGKDPRNYHGQDYVKTLAESQNTDGKFIIGQWDDYPTTVAFSMLALDMAKADYDVEKAVEALLSYQDGKGSFGDSVDDTAMSIIALGNHKDIEGVEAAITKGIAYLKANQKASGGFEAWGEENPYSVSAVIQSLIALGEDPLSEEWTKNGNTMLDALLSYKVDDHFENPSQWGTETVMATEQAFCALADLYRGKSMFHEISIKVTEPHEVTIQTPSSTTIKENGKLKLTANVYNAEGEILLGHNLIWESSDENIAQVDSDGLVTAVRTGTANITVRVEGFEDISDTIELTVEPEEFKVTRIDTEEIKNGSEAKLEFQIQYTGEEAKSATLIVAIYDKNTNKMINYSFAAKEFKSGESTNLGAGFLVPDTGKYIIKCFAWDSFENQDIILANPIEIEVQQ